MSIKEIEKLREKVEKDPNSKLYVPLAEEYRKEGMLDQAIEVLQKGLEKQPGYMSARVSLGKIYLEKGQMDEALVEFENVVKLIPDNLYAHKKLAEIYRDTGKKDLAIQSFKTFLKLNPMDEEALNNLQQLEGAQTEPLAENIQGHAAPVSEQAVAHEEETPFQSMSIEQTAFEQPEVDHKESAEELDAFKQSLFALKSEAGDERPEDLLVAEEEIPEDAPAEEADEEWSFGEKEVDQASVAADAAGVEQAEKDNMEIEEIPQEAVDELSFGEMASGPPDSPADEDSIEIEDTAEGDSEELSFADIAEVLKNTGLEEPEKAETTYEIHSAQVSSEADGISPKDNSALFRNADNFISEGNYLGAINVYQRILAAAPGDKKILQSIEELRSLLKLMGKDKEVLISKLNAFQSAIKKRGDEFFRRS